MRRLFLIPVVLGLSAYLLLPLPGSGAPLSERIERKRARVERAARQEGVLTQEIAGYGVRIDRLQGEIGATQDRLAGAQANLDAKRRELTVMRDRLQVARDRLARLRKRLDAGKAALARRLVELYKADQPDALTVVLEADGFSDLLDQVEFLDRIADQDRVVVDRVRGLKAQATVRTRELASLEQRIEVAANFLLGQRDDIASARDRLVGARDELASARQGRRATLASVQGDRRAAQEDLVALEAEQASVAQQLGAPPAGPIRRGSGQFIWPLDGTFTSPFGQRWGRLHAGIDVAVPEGTPIRAADSGTVAIAAFTGGYGNYTCIQHSASLSSCYAHQSRLGTSAGASVSQGQVIGYSGNTGNSTGPHLHFEVRVGGSPVDPMGYL